MRYKCQVCGGTKEHGLILYQSMYADGDTICTVCGQWLLNVENETGIYAGPSAWADYKATGRFTRYDPITKD